MFNSKTTSRGVAERAKRIMALHFGMAISYHWTLILTIYVYIAWENHKFGLALSNDVEV